MTVYLNGEYLPIEQAKVSVLDRGFIYGDGVYELVPVYDRMRGVEAHTRTGAPGVYVTQSGADAKIAALGLKVSRGCTYHGLALNVAMDLSPFSDIDPCGYPGLAVTQLRDVGVVSTVEQAGASLAPVLCECLDEA